MGASLALEEVLLLLKIGFLVLLYLFVWGVIRSARRELRLPQESMIMAPVRSGGAAAAPTAQGRLVVVRSSNLPEGHERALDSAPVTVGRGAHNDVPLPDDEFASARHARFEPRVDGVWVEDVGSTNGTYVNGVRLTRARKLEPGDVVRIGETDLQFEA